MKERDFTSEVARSIPWLTEATGSPAAYFKIPDSAPGPRFGAVKFFDSVLCHQGRFVALEAKLAKQTALAFDALRDVQEQALQAVVDAGGLAFVLVNFRVTFSVKEAARRGTTKAILAFAVPIRQWIATRAEACRASLPLTWFETEAISIPRIRLSDGQAGWDLRPILEARTDTTLNVDSQQL